MITYRIALESELQSIADIELEVMPQPWNLSSYKAAYASDSGKIYVAYDADQETIAGFVVLYVAVDEGEIPDVVVAPDYRRQGVAQSLMTYIFTDNPDIQSYFLEVRESNEAAIGLYNKLGFAQVGIRKNFYTDPIENALCMSKNRL